MKHHEVGHSGPWIAPVSDMGRQLTLPLRRVILNGARRHQAHVYILAICGIEPRAIFARRSPINAEVLIGLRDRNQRMRLLHDDRAGGENGVFDALEWSKV